MWGQQGARDDASVMGAVLVVIPAYNEEESIRKVVQGVNRHIPMADVLVVDDGSSDDTSRRVQESGAELLRLPRNLGVGAALEVALRYAEDMGYSYALRLDADGQHDPQDALRLLAAAMRGEADVLIGSRFLDLASLTGAVILISLTVLVKDLFLMILLTAFSFELNPTVADLVAVVMAALLSGLASPIIHVILNRISHLLTKELGRKKDMIVGVD